MINVVNISTSEKFNPFRMLGPVELALRVNHQNNFVYYAVII